MSRADHRIRRARGFSLLELLVALAVFALVVLALLNLSGESVRTAVVVEERTLAAVVADNRAVESALLPLDALRAARTGRDELGGRRWRWTRTLVPTDDAALVRVEIAVRPEGARHVAAEAQLLRRAR